MVPNERFELADELRVTAEDQVRVDPVLECTQPAFLEAGDLDLGEFGVGELGERVAPP